jgi:hypothetical protein
MNKEDRAQFGGGVALKYPQKPDPDADEANRRKQGAQNSTPQEDPVIKFCLGCPVRSTPFILTEEFLESWHETMWPTIQEFNRRHAEAERESMFHMVD